MDRPATATREELSKALCDLIQAVFPLAKQLGLYVEIKIKEADRLTPLRA